MSDEPIEVADSGRGVTTITLNRPQARNALDTPLLNALFAAMTTAVDAGAAAIVLTGAPPAFCSGADLVESAQAMQNDSFWSQHERVERSQRIHLLIPRLPIPVIAAVNGPAVAGGCGLALSCDIVIAGASARFGYPEVSHGLVAAMAMVSLSRATNRHDALDLLLTGRLVGAEEAHRIGLATYVVPDEELRSFAEDLAHRIAAHPTSALRITKALYRHVAELDYDRALDYARDVNMLVRHVDDARQGAQRFVDTKEQP